jgi:hypothetical protein
VWWQHSHTAISLLLYPETLSCTPYQPPPKYLSSLIWAAHTSWSGCEPSSLVQTHTKDARAPLPLCLQAVHLAGMQPAELHLFYNFPTTQTSHSVDNAPLNTVRK